MTPVALAVALLLSGCVWPASCDPQPPLAPNTTWQSRPPFWRLSEVSWSPPEDAVYANHSVLDACSCGQLCLMNRSCVAADLVATSDGLSCRLAARRGSSTDNTTAVTAFVRLGRAELGERCLTDDECWQALEGAGCVDGVCACRVPELTARGDCVISDCTDLTALGVTASGQHWVRLAEGDPPAAVFCNMVSDGGGWTVFQRRKNEPEQVSFYRYWQEYRDGFGDVSGQFWLGNELIHRLTARRPHQLRIVMNAFDGAWRYAEYDTFSVANETDNYRLSVSGYSGTAGDALSYHNGKPFSTRDRDNDLYAASCSRQFKGGWWYGRCHRANLNGHYYPDSVVASHATGVSWFDWLGHENSLMLVAMQMRPVDASLRRR